MRVYAFKPQGVRVFTHLCDKSIIKIGVVVKYGTKKTRNIIKQMMFLVVPIMLFGTTVLVNF